MARASVDALSKMQVPQSKVVRGGQVLQVPAVDVVPGDIVNVEAGDIVPADGRIIRSATLETQEAALTGESAPIAKQAGVLPAGRDRRRRPVEHAVPEHVGDPRYGGDGRDGDRHGHADGPDRHHADLGHPDPVAAAEGARLADQGARRDRLDGGRDHRGRRPHQGVVGQGRAAAGHGDGDLGHPDRSADVRVGDAVLRRQAARRGEGGRQEPDRRRDPRRHQRDQHRQDRHADDEPDDGVGAVRRRLVVHGGG